MQPSLNEQLYLLKGRRFEILDYVALMGLDTTKRDSNPTPQLKELARKLKFPISE